MAYRVDLPSKVRKVLDDLDDKTFRRIDSEIARLADEPRPAGAMKLDSRLYRIRVGDWRVIYAIFDDLKLVQLVRVARRSESTYRRLH